VIIEWAERLGEREFPARVISIDIQGDGDEPRRITIIRKEQNAANAI